MADLPIALLYEIIRYELVSQFTLLWLSKKLRNRFKKQVDYLQTLMEEMYSSNARQLNFDACI